MLVSILHRATGVGMATVGVLVFTWWLAALAGGEAAYVQFQSIVFVQPIEGPLDYLWNAIRLAIPVGLTWAFFQHMSNGIRHWFMDIGTNYELKANKRSAMTALIAPLVLTAAVWAYLLLIKGVA